MDFRCLLCCFRPEIFRVFHFFIRAEYVQYELELEGGAQIRRFQCFGPFFCSGYIQYDFVLARVFAVSSLASLDFRLAIYTGGADVDQMEQVYDLVLSGI